MKILHLTLKKQWFDLIASGVKKTEYREMKSYWLERLVDLENRVDPMHPDYFKKFDEVHFKNGYAVDSPFMRVKYLKTDRTPPKLITYSDGTKLHLETSCDEIYLGEILEIKNH